MAITIEGDGDVFKVEIKDRGPARVTVKVAPTKGRDEGAIWKSTFIDVDVWGGPDRDGHTTPGAHLVHTLQPRDKIRFSAKGKTDVWTDKQTGKERAALKWTATSLELVSSDNRPAPVAPAGDDDPLPF